MQRHVLTPVTPVVHLVAVRGRLQRVDADDLLKTVDLNQNESVLEDRSGRDAAEQEIRRRPRRR